MNTAFRKKKVVDVYRLEVKLIEKIADANGVMGSGLAVEKVFFLSLRAKRGNLAFNKIKGLEIASSSRKLSGLLAMTCDGFFNSLLIIDFEEGQIYNGDELVELIRLTPSSCLPHIWY